MKRIGVLLALLVLVTASALADTVITRDSASYTGQFLGAQSGTIGFTDTSGIQYSFPIRDVQSLVFTTANDTVTLRNGKLYSGKFMGSDPLAFKDNLGILYQFPKKDVESLAFQQCRSHASDDTAAECKSHPHGNRDLHSDARDDRLR